jgi:hypothetical protein
VCAVHTPEEQILEDGLGTREIEILLFMMMMEEEEET